MEKTKVLFITHEMNPFTNLSVLGDIAHSLSKGLQKKDMEVRVFMPRFGKINERRHRLHEVIRLSGINIQVGEDDNPMIIKVASLPSAKMQVYFLDNEDLFKRKAYFRDENEELFSDNDERMIFFNKGVMEILQKLEWNPDIVHCHGWFSSLVPVYGKTLYKDEPVFKDSRFLVTSYDEGLEENFGEQFFDKTLLNGEASDQQERLKNPAIKDLYKAGIDYADGCALGSSEVSQELASFAKEKSNPLLELDKNQDENQIAEAYHDFYNKLLQKEKV